MARSPEGPRRAARSRAAPSPPPRSAAMRARPTFWLAAALPLVLAATRLPLDLWYDEVYTLHFFAAQDVGQIVTDYSAPNNHVLYSLLLHFVQQISHEDWVLRLPSLVLVAITLGATFRLACRAGEAAAAAAAVLCLGLNVLFLVYAMQVRGYGLSMGVIAWLVEWTLRAPPVSHTTAAAASTDPRRRALAICLLATAALYTLPTNVLFVAPLALVAITHAAVVDRSARATLRAAAPWLAAAVLTLVAYAPLWDGLRQASRSGSPVSPPNLVAWASQFIAATWHDSWPLVLLSATGLIAAWFRLRRSAPSPIVAVNVQPFDRWLPYAALAACILPWILSLALPSRPFLRNYTPLLPLLSVMLGCGLTATWNMLTSASKRGRALATAAPWLPHVAIVALLLPAVIAYPARLRGQRVQQPAEDGYYNYYAADFEPSRVADYFAREGPRAAPYVMLYGRSDHFVLEHYLARQGLRPFRATATSSSPPPRGAPDSASVFLVVPDAPPRQRELLRQELGERFSLPAAEIDAASEVAAFGYYRVQRLPAPHTWPAWAR